jgi:hypothetical protein
LRIAFLLSSGIKSKFQNPRRARGERARIDPHPPAATTVGLSQDTGEANRKAARARLYPLDPRIGGRILLGVEMNPIGKSA